MRWLIQMNNSMYKKICAVCLFICFTFSLPVMAQDTTALYQYSENNGALPSITDTDSDVTDTKSVPTNNKADNLPTTTPTIMPTATTSAVAPTITPTATPTPENTPQPVTAPADKLIYALNCSDAFINGNLINTYTIPYMYDGMSMLPIERIVEFLGGSCSYNLQTRILTLYLNDKSTDISVDDEYCAIFETMFYPVRLVADKLGINMAWYDGIVVLSNNEPWIYGDEPTTYKNALGYTGYDDRIWTNRPTPEHFVYPYNSYSYDQMNNDLHTLK